MTYHPFALCKLAVDLRHFAPEHRDAGFRHDKRPAIRKWKVPDETPHVVVQNADLSPMEEHTVTRRGLAYGAAGAGFFKYKSF